MAKPTKKPTWASTLQNGPVYGQPNYAEPPTAQKTYGFSELSLIPRQWVNWLFRTIKEWIDYFEAQDDALTLPGLLAFSKTLAGAAGFYTDQGGVTPTTTQGIIMPYDGTVKILMLGGAGGPQQNATDMTFIAGDTISVYTSYSAPNYTVSVRKNGAASGGPSITGALGTGLSYATVSFEFDRA